MRARWTADSPSQNPPVMAWTVVARWFPNTYHLVSTLELRMRSSDDPLSVLLRKADPDVQDTWVTQVFRCSRDGFQHSDNPLYKREYFDEGAARVGHMEIVDALAKGRHMGALLGYTPEEVMRLSWLRAVEWLGVARVCIAASSANPVSLLAVLLRFGLRCRRYSNVAPCPLQISELHAISCELPFRQTEMARHVNYGRVFLLAPRVSLRRADPHHSADCNDFGPPCTWRNWPDTEPFNHRIALSVGLRGNVCGRRQESDRGEWDFVAPLSGQEKSGAIFLFFDHGSVQRANSASFNRLPPLQI